MLEESNPERWNEGIIVSLEEEARFLVFQLINIFDVAKYILDSVGGNVSAMKLQKLRYYLQAWNLAWEEVPLFP
jgi:hypothetical protein